jgi:hypothetical protein
MLRTIMKKIEEYNFQMPSFLLSAVFNGDTNGLESEDDLEALHNIQKWIYGETDGTNRYAMWAIEDGAEEYFCSAPDFAKEACYCYDVKLIIMED